MQLNNLSDYHAWRQKNYLTSVRKQHKWDKMTKRWFKSKHVKTEDAVSKGCYPVAEASGWKFNKVWTCRQRHVRGSQMGVAMGNFAATQFWARLDPALPFCSISAPQQPFAPSAKVCHRNDPRIYGEDKPQNNGNSDSLYFLGFQNHCKWWLQPWN